MIYLTREGILANERREELAFTWEMVIFSLMLVGGLTEKIPNCFTNDFNSSCNFFQQHKRTSPTVPTLDFVDPLDAKIRGVFDPREFIYFIFHF